ncbi:NACHT domain-containing protein [Streptomyces armeniacus]|uniref:NACHT domain-containing protein n=1 Tax=Streptomyces armeniacus TaxID=83291 RepID=A0A345XWW9_9ACTN|nr:NACHT domain-containing protein [Streptomyces armeniacus]AXK36135.1 NACHT domain-containing protein [Streptomyces armeniacus]
MEPGAAAGLRLASSVVTPLLKKLFVQPDPGADLVREPVRVSALVSFKGEQRTLGKRQLQKLTAELVRRAVRDADPYERPVGEDEEQAVALALARTLLVLGDVGMEDVQAVRLGHREFARLLRDGDPRAARDLSGDAEQLYVSLLDTACLHILHFFTQRSAFVARSLVEQSRQLAENVRKLDVLIERVPAQSAADARFERRYADFVVRKHGTLTIHGLDLQQCREWPLDAAYLTLEATESRPRQRDDPSQAGVQLTTAQPADRALAGRDRVLLRGVAGSGKTTLVQWLAVTTARQDTARQDTARQDTPPGMTHLLGRVPFVLPLRTLTRGGAELPVPDRFLAATSCLVAGSQPPGWADRVLDAGRGLLLVDGIDEVPEEERERTRRWLRDLVTAFPGNLWLVTSRPSAVREDWLDADGFTELSLAPMHRPDVAAFVHRWHRAAGADPALGEALLTSVRGKQDLGRLATNPLMCGLICALHRERRGFLPRGRKALYDAALSMLLERRDRERDMHRPGGIDLDEESQTELLQKLAYWLIRNGRAEMDQSDAVELLARVLPSMPQVSAQGSVEEIFRHLLVRSGLLREPAPNGVDFIHRTFQDYLGAREAVEERDFDLLIRHAHLDQWEDVLRMAVAHARPDERARLLRGVLARGDTEYHSRRLHLLAMACLEHATKLAPEVREEVERRAAALIPPRSTEEAKALAEAGPVVLELLPGPEGLEDDEAVAVVQTACLIGTDAALPTVVRFLDHPDAGVRRELGAYWGHFDTETYAHEVIRHLAEDPEVVVALSTDEELAAVESLGNLSSVMLGGAFTPEQMCAALSPDHLVRLRLVENPGISDLAFLQAFPRLADLELWSCGQVRDLAPLAQLPLRRFWAFGLKELAPDALGACTHLETIALDEVRTWPGLSSVLPPSAPLNELLLPAETDGLVGIDAYPALRFLQLQAVRGELRAADWAAVANHPGISALSLRPDQISGAAGAGARLPHVGLVFLHAEDDPLKLADLPRLFPNLESLTVRDCQHVGLSALAELPQLSEVECIRPGLVRGADALPPSVTVTITPRPRGEQ